MLGCSRSQAEFLTALNRGRGGGSAEKKSQVKNSRGEDLNSLDKVRGNKSKVHWEGEHKELSLLYKFYSKSQHFQEGGEGRGTKGWGVKDGTEMFRRPTQRGKKAGWGTFKR